MEVDARPKSGKLSWGYLLCKPSQNAVPPIDKVELVGAKHAFGRSPDCNTVLGDFPVISSEHFNITTDFVPVPPAHSPSRSNFRCVTARLTDTSRNGTIVDGKLLRKGESVILDERSLIEFKGNRVPFAFEFHPVLLTSAEIERLAKPSNGSKTKDDRSDEVVVSDSSTDAATIATLRRRVKQLEDLLASTKVSNNQDGLDALLKNARDELKQKNALLETALSERDLAESNASKISRDLRLCEQRLEALRDSETALKEDVIKANKQRELADAKLLSEVQVLQAKHSETLAEMSQVHANQMHALEKRLAETERLYQLASSEKGSALSEKEKAMNMLKEKIARLEIELEKQSEHFRNELEKQTEIFADRERSLESEKAKLVDSLKQAAEDLQLARQSQNEMSEALTKAVQQVHEVQNEVEVKITQLSKQNATLESTLEHDRSSWLKEKQELLSGISIAEENAKGLEAEIARLDGALREARSTAKAEVDKMIHSREEAENKLTVLEKQLTDVQELANDYYSRSKIAAEEHEKTKTATSILMSSLQSLVSSFASEFSSKVQQLDAQAILGPATVSTLESHKISPKRPLPIGAKNQEGHGTPTKFLKRNQTEFDDDEGFNGDERSEISSKRPRLIAPSGLANTLVDEPIGEELNHNDSIRTERSEARDGELRMSNTSNSQSSVRSTEERKSHHAVLSHPTSESIIITQIPETHITQHPNASDGPQSAQQRIPSSSVFDNMD